MSQSPANTSFQPDEFVVEFDGKGVHPGDFAVEPALHVVYTFVQLVRQVAKQKGGDLSVTGLRIVDKCAAFALRVSDTALAQQAVTASTELLSDPTASGGPGIKRALSQVRKARSALPKHYATHVRVGTAHRQVNDVQHSQLGPFTSIETLRVIPERIGGRQAAVRLYSLLDAQSFTLSVTREQARALGPYLYLEIQVQAQLTRTALGKLLGGELIAFTALSDQSPRLAWEAWYQNAASGFDAVQDIEAAIGRG